MNNDFWLNLPSKNLPQAKIFFTKLGFTINERHNGPHMVSMFVGDKKIVLNLFTEELFQSFINHPVTNTKESNEIIFSLGADSPTEVDAIANKAVEAGANLFAKPGYKDGWMYGCGFADLDGHRWNILYMDMSKMPS